MSKCIICGNALTGQQTTYCRYDCRKEGYRRKYHKTKVLKGYKRTRKLIDLDILFDNNLNVEQKMERLDMSFYALKACFYRKRKHYKRYDAKLTYKGCNIPEVRRIKDLNNKNIQKDDEVDKRAREILKCMK